MKNILVFCYAISPTRGSEYSVSWNYVLNMSKDNNLVVIYGTSGDHLGDVDEFENYISKNPVNNAKFIPIRASLWVNVLNILNKKGIFRYSFYFAYNIWQRDVYSYCKNLIKVDDFDLIHFLCPIGYREPGYLWKLPLPYLWGPIGGTTNVNSKLLNALSFQGKLKYSFRTLANFFQLRYKYRVRMAIRRSDTLIAATTENMYRIKEVFDRDSYYLPENGVFSNSLSKSPRFFFSNEILQLVWIGRIDEGKALNILIEALNKLKNIQRVVLNVVGDGFLKLRLEELAKIKGVHNSIVWHGLVSRVEVLNLLKDMHLHVLTSISEANTTVLFEAMSQAVPTLTLDHCGMHDTVCDKCGVKIPIKSYEQIINDIAFNIDRLIENPELIERLSEGVIECSNKYTWDKRRVFFNDIYDKTILNWEQKKIAKKR